MVARRAAAERLRCQETGSAGRSSQVVSGGASWSSTPAASNRSRIASAAAQSRHRGRAHVRPAAHPRTGSPTRRDRGRLPRPSPPGTPRRPGALSGLWPGRRIGPCPRPMPGSSPPGPESPEPRPGRRTPRENVEDTLELRHFLAQQARRFRRPALTGEAAVPAAAALPDPVCEAAADQVGDPRLRPGREDRATAVLSNRDRAPNRAPRPSRRPRPAPARCAHPRPG